MESLKDSIVGIIVLGVIGSLIASVIWQKWREQANIIGLFALCVCSSVVTVFIWQKWHPTATVANVPTVVSTRKHRAIDTSQTPTPAYEIEVKALKAQDDALQKHLLEDYRLPCVITPNVGSLAWPAYKRSTAACVSVINAYLSNAHKIDTSRCPAEVAEAYSQALDDITECARILGPAKQLTRQDEYAWKAKMEEAFKAYFDSQHQLEIEYTKFIR